MRRRYPVIEVRAACPSVCSSGWPAQSGCLSGRLTPRCASRAACPQGVLPLGASCPSVRPAPWCAPRGGIRVACPLVYPSGQPAPWCGLPSVCLWGGLPLGAACPRCASRGGLPLGAPLGAAFGWLVP